MERNSGIRRLVSGTAAALYVAVVVGLLSPANTFAASAAPTRTELRHAQEILVSLGYKLGTPDGSWGPRTRAAVKSFQIQFGLKPTGRLDRATAQALDVRAAPLPQASAPALAQADTGDAANLPSGDGRSASQDSGGTPFVGLAIIALLGWFVWRKSKGTSAATSAQPSPRQNSPSPTSYRADRPSQQAPGIDARMAAGAGLTLSGAEQSRRSWVPPGRLVVIAGHTINGGMLYVGTQLARQDGYGAENCLINPALDASTKIANDSGANIPYWPSYANLDPSSRLSYLKWLESGRKDPTIYVGYVFLYFYGLERCLMLDNPGDEAAALINEVWRLFAVYHDNHSFERYASALLSAAAIKFNRPVDWPLPSMRKLTWQLPLDLLVCLGRAAAQGIPLNAAQMLAWYNAHPDKRLPPVAARCPEEFQTLFAKRFAVKYPGGVKLDIPKRRLAASYRAASGTFNVNFEGAAASLPDFSGIVAPLDGIDSLVETCVADLSTYARLVTKDGSPKNAVAAAAALPVQLLQTASARPVADFKTWLQTRVANSATAIPLRELLDRVGAATSPAARVAKADVTLLADVLARCDFGIEPDPRMAYSSLAPDDDVVIFPADGGARLDAIRPEFLSAFAHMDIGMLVAAADGTVATAEMQALEDAIRSNAGLAPVERKRLAARLVFLAKSPPTARILVRFKDRPLPDREAVARLALAIAAADGRMAVEELRLLEKIYKALELPAQRLYSDVQAFGLRDEELQTVAPAEPAKFIPVPPRPSSAAPAISLDAKRLERTRADTAVVSSILGEIFRDEDATIQLGSAGVTSGRAVVDHSQFAGLDEKYVPLMAEIVQRENVSRSDFEALAGSHSLLCDGAIEAINDWAYGRFDAPILDDGPQIVINRTVLNLPGRQAA